MGTERHARAFFRHPSGIPIQIAAEPGLQSAGRRLKDVGLGGLACQSPVPLVIGSMVNVTIPLVRPPFETQGRVVWCNNCFPHFDVGIEFMAKEDAYATRMVEQICHIEHYRNTVLETEGRQLDGEEAAVEWIRKFAADFPSHLAP